jgi:hypothetical protein
MHCGSGYILGLLGPAPNKAAAMAMVLSTNQASALVAALKQDASDYFYSGCLSVVDGIRGLVGGFYTWPTIKLYYSVFYSLRSILAAEGVCVFYIGRKPFVIKSTAGCKPSILKGTTHESILKLFTELYPAHLLVSQPIGYMPALRWLLKQREDCNYKNPRFSEPIAPEHFRKIELIGVRNLVSAYVADAMNTFTFDKDHAMLAYPLASLSHAAITLRSQSGLVINDEELRFLLNECRDSKGRLSPLTNFFMEMM